MAKQTFTTGAVLTAAAMTSLQQTAMGGGSATAKTASYVLVAADAGTTVIMNAAGSTTITVNGSLFSAGDTVLIQNIGAGTCTVTAGTATVSTAGSLALTQYEAGILYFTAAGTALFHDYVQTGSNPLTTTGDMIYSSSGSTQARLPIGSTSQVLTVASGVPSWATPSSSAISWTLLHDTVALTGSSTSFTGLSGYNYLKVLVRVMKSSDATNFFRATFNSDTSGKYFFYGVLNQAQQLYNYEPQMLGSDSTQGDSKLVLIQRGDNAQSEVNGVLNIVGAKSTSHKMFDYSFGATAGPTGRGSGNRVQGGFYQGTSVISSIELFLSTGTFSAGTVTIYGGN